MLNNPGGSAGEPEVAPDAKPPPRASFGLVCGQLVLVVLAGLYLFGVVWLYIQVPWLALVAGAVAAGILLSGVFRRMRSPLDR